MKDLRIGSNVDVEGDLVDCACLLALLQLQEVLEVVRLARWPLAFPPQGLLMDVHNPQQLQARPKKAGIHRKSNFLEGSLELQMLPKQ